MDTNKMREEFIRAYRVMLIKTDMNVQRRHFELQDGEFVDRQTAIAWWAWQASRAAVVVDLSDLSRCFSPNDCGDWAMWLDDVKKLIEAQGLKVTP